MGVIAELTKTAKSQIGNNATKYRKWYYQRTTDYYGVHWCAIFVSWLFAQVGGIDKYVVKTDGAGCFAREGNGKYGKWYSRTATTPKEGDIITFRWGGNYTDIYHSDHVGYVYNVDGGYVYTIEGNTDSNNPDYSLVSCKCYQLNNTAINGYFRPYYQNTETGDNAMEIQKGDRNEFVLAYKALLRQAQTLGIISVKVDTSNSFGDGTYKATVEIQKKYHLDVDGIAGVQTITALRNAIEDKTKDVRKAVITDIIEALRKEVAV